MRLFFPQKMKISRDIVESVIDVGSGFFLAVIIQLTIFPLFDLHPTILDSMGIAIIFTIVSMTRSALWRRFFRKRKND
jgi:membrane protein implicated in regulation of membrane protease activity